MNRLCKQHKHGKKVQKLIIELFECSGPSNHKADVGKLHFESYKVDTYYTFLTIDSNNMIEQTVR